MVCKLNKLLISQLVIFCFISQNIRSTPNNFDSIKKFIFLENKLSKQPKENISEKVKEYSIRRGIPLAASFILYKLLQYFFWENIESTWAKTTITWLAHAKDYEAAYKKINRLLFVTGFLIIFFVIAKLYKKGDLTNSEILERFIKRWPINKINTPEMFHKMFNSMYNIFVQNKRLEISEVSAELILRNITKETIDFVTNNNDRQKMYNEMEDLQKKLQKIELTDEARETIKNEIIQLKRMSTFSTITTILRNHIDWLIELPWGKYTKDTVDIKKAKKILDQEHFGLENVKERILDFLAVKSLKQDCKTPILCLSGPPGVGKTSIGKSIAKCLGRTFFRLSLGGVDDESEIRGHRKTYVGAMPGRFIQAIKKTGSCNPLIMLDEIDKLGRSNKGNPSAALLEVLDPEQNNAFYDNYLGIHFDLSSVMFIATANDVQNIPKPLKDRMEIIELKGYNLEEKLEITKRHIIPEAIKDVGIKGKGFELKDKTLVYIIKNYSKKPGMRELKKLVYTLCSKFARHLLEKNRKLEFSTENISEYISIKT